MINASGRSGANADPEALRAEGLDHIPREHPLSVTIPGCVDGLAQLSNRFGTWELGRCLQPGIDLASDGFPASDEQARAFSALAGLYRANPAVADFYPGGEPIAPGAGVKRPDLARTLQRVAEGGRAAFYEGVAGEDIVAALAPHVTAEDLSREQFQWVEPIGVEVGDDIAWTAPPNSAGYLGPGALAVFSRLDSPDDTDDPLWWHLLIESHRALAWERDLLVADPDSAPLGPAYLLSDERLDSAAASISRDEAGVWPSPPTRPGGTAYMCVADGRGMAVSIINSNYWGTGSAFGAARSGFLLQNRGGGFVLEPGHPNVLAPAKRPAHTLSPTLWTRGDRASWLLGTRGGEIQPQLIAQLGARAILRDEPAEEAQARPRWSVTSQGPDRISSISLEPGAGVGASLERLGHRVTELDSVQPGWGPMGIIDLTGDEPIAAADPRVATSKALVL